MDTEIIWAAGLFEGEGSIGKNRLQLKMVSEVSVRRFAAAVGVGKVYGPYGPYPSQLGRKPYYVWVAERQAMAAAAALLTPWVSDPWKSRLAHQ